MCLNSGIGTHGTQASIAFCPLLNLDAEVFQASPEIVYNLLKTPILHSEEIGVASDQSKHIRR